MNELGKVLNWLREDGMRIEVVDPGRNLGFSGGVNRGLSEIGERFGSTRVLMINSDAQLLPNSLQPLHTAIDAGATIAAPLLQGPDGQVRAEGHYHRLTGLLVEKAVPGSFRYLSGCCFLLSPTIATHQLLDERFFFYGEDVELSWRLKRRGVVTRLVRESRVLHLGSGSSRRGSLFYEYHMARSHLELAKALANNQYAAHGLLIGRLFVLPLKGGWRALRQASTIPLRGLAMALRDFATGTVRDLTPPPRVDV